MQRNRDSVRIHGVAGQWHPVDDAATKRHVATADRCRRFTRELPPMSRTGSLESDINQRQTIRLIRASAKEVPKAMWFRSGFALVSTIARIIMAAKGSRVPGRVTLYGV